MEITPLMVSLHQNHQIFPTDRLFLDKSIDHQFSKTGPCVLSIVVYIVVEVLRHYVIVVFKQRVQYWFFILSIVVLRLDREDW